MTNYIEALGQGLEAARLRDVAKKEISAFLNDVSEQVSTATDGLIAVEIRQFTRAQSAAALNAFYSLAESLSNSKRENYNAVALVPSNKNTTQQKTPRQIARWESLNGGYPIKIQVDGGEITCHDKEALSSCFASILASANTGEKLKTMLSEAGIADPTKLPSPPSPKPPGLRRLRTK